MVARLRVRDRETQRHDIEEWRVRLFDALLAWQQRAAERRHLAALDDRLLKDMGLSRADVAQELEKPMWRA